MDMDMDIIHGFTHFSCLTSDRNFDIKRWNRIGQLREFSNISHLHNDCIQLIWHFAEKSGIHSLPRFLGLDASHCQFSLRQRSVFSFFLRFSEQQSREQVRSLVACKIFLQNWNSNCTFKAFLAWAIDREETGRLWILSLLKDFN